MNPGEGEGGGGVGCYSDFRKSHQRDGRPAGGPATAAVLTCCFVDDGSKSTAAQLARSTGYLLQNYQVRHNELSINYKTERSCFVDSSSGPEYGQ